MMQKTLLVTLDFWPAIGGVANYYFNVCKQLNDQAVVLTTQALKHKNIKTLKQELGFKIVRRNLLVNWLWPQWLPMVWHVWRVAKREKIEILWVGEVLPTGTVVYMLSKFLKLPYIVSCHGNDILQASKVSRRKKVAQKILAGAEVVVVNSHYTGELTKSLGVESEKIKVVYPGIDSRFPASLGRSGAGKIQDSRIKDALLKKYNLEGKKIILSIGRLVARKGFDKVIEVMPRIVEKVPEAVYLIAGDGPDMSRLKHLSIKAPTHIIFLGKVNDEEKWTLMEACDVFVMPARKTTNDVEGFGIVYLEAALCGKPIIASDVGGAKEAVVKGRTGLLVNPENVEEIRWAIIKLLNDKELAERLGGQGRQRVVEEFDWRKIGQEFKESLEEIGIDNN